MSGISKLLTFSLGGVHPSDHKALTQDCAIETMPVPDELDLILGQHIGAPCEPLVKRMDTIGEGDLIGEVKKGLGTNLHAPVAGKVKALGQASHPTKVKVPCLTITVDHAVAPKEYEKTPWESLEASELLERIKDAGLVGCGGAGFPTHVKLQPPKDSEVDTLILNGAECEPYITADHRLMLEFPEEIAIGARILMKILKVRRCLLGIESNKANAIQAMETAASAHSTSDAQIEVKTMQVKYPQGAEKQLIFALTGRKIPSGALPAAVGCVVQNVSTAYAAYQAVVENHPLIERVVTVSGLGIARQANLRVKIGTRLSDIVEYLGGLTPEVRKVVLGGPMMGFAVSDLSIPVTKTTSSILFLTEAETNQDPPSPCIRCGWCLDACPQGLEPKEIAIYVEANRAAETPQFGLFDCVECGSCAYVCPAKRPLVQFIRLAKQQAKRS